MPDVIECKGCGLRTTAEFCTECLRKHEEVERLAAQFAPQLAVPVMQYMASPLGAPDISVAEESLVKKHIDQTNKAAVLQAFAMAEAFVEIRAQRRSRLSRSPT